MDVSPGELIAAGIALAGAAATWGAVNQRLKDQGRRIGKVESAQSEMTGLIKGLMRRRTAAHPIPITPDEEPPA